MIKKSCISRRRTLMEAEYSWNLMCLDLVHCLRSSYSTAISETRLERFWEIFNSVDRWWSWFRLV